MLWIVRHPKNLWDERYQHPYTKFLWYGQNYADNGNHYGYFLCFALAGMPPFFRFFGASFI